MKRIHLLPALLCCLWGCRADVPFIDSSGSLYFAMYGVLQPGTAENWLRIEPIKAEDPSFPDQQAGAATVASVTLKDLDSGDVIPVEPGYSWFPSLYRIGQPLVAGHRYRVSARTPGGHASEATLTVAAPPAETIVAGDSTAVQVRVRGAERIVSLLIVWYSEGYTLGSWRIRAQDFQHTGDWSTYIARYSADQGPATRTPDAVDVTLVTGTAEWPEDPFMVCFDPLSSGLESNVSNGWGFVYGAVVQSFRIEGSTITPGAPTGLPNAMPLCTP